MADNKDPSDDRSAFTVNVFNLLNVHLFRSDGSLSNARSTDRVAPAGSGQVDEVQANKIKKHKRKERKKDILS